MHLFHTICFWMHPRKKELHIRLIWQSPKMNRGLFTPCQLVGCMLPSSQKKKTNAASATTAWPLIKRFKIKSVFTRMLVLYVIPYFVCCEPLKTLQKTFCQTTIKDTEIHCHVQGWHFRHSSSPQKHTIEHHLLICSLTHIRLIWGMDVSSGAPSASHPCSSSSTTVPHQLLKQRRDGWAFLSTSLLFCAVGGCAACETEFKLLLSFNFYSVSPTLFLARSNMLSPSSHWQKLLCAFLSARHYSRGIRWRICQHTHT